MADTLDADYAAWRRQQARISRQSPDQQAMTHAGARPAPTPERRVPAPFRFMGERYELPVSLPESNAPQAESLSQMALPQGPGDLALAAAVGPMAKLGSGAMSVIGRAIVGGAGLSMDPDSADAMFLGFNKAKAPPRGALGDFQRGYGRVPESRLWEDTGVMVGRDGKPRWEIDDSTARLNLPAQGNSVRLDRAWEHPELFRQYPRLSGMRVAVEDTGDPRIAGYYNPQERKIVVSPYGGDARGTIAHEVQHAVQDAEGHTSGGLPDLLTTYATLPMRQRRVALYDKYQRTGLGGMTAGEIDELKTLQDQLKALEHPTAQRVFYDRSFGEAEARNTEARLGLDDYYRRLTPPTSTMDVAMSETYAHPSIKDMNRAVERYNGSVRALSPSMPNPERDRLINYARELGDR
ncbi:MAG: hypothetical protein RLZZ403_384 [Pseudomonadota bacterium]|jgi:hypothetical protein